MVSLTAWVVVEVDPYGSFFTRTKGCVLEA